MFCKHCGSKMSKVYRFTPDGKSLELYKCDKCYFESKSVPMKFDSKLTQENKGKNKKKNSSNKKGKRKKEDNVRSLHNNYKRVKEA